MSQPHKISPQNGPRATRQKAAPKSAAALAVREFPVWQARLALALGVPIEEVRELRDQYLLRDVDWRFDSENHVVLTEPAAQKLAGLVLAVADDSRPVATLPPGALKPAEARLAVTRAGPSIRNVHLLEGRLAAASGAHAAGTVVCVRVKDNLLFRAGDEITARHDQGHFYDLTSRPPKRMRKT